MAAFEIRPYTTAGMLELEPQEAQIWEHAAWVAQMRDNPTVDPLSSGESLIGWYDDHPVVAAGIAPMWLRRGQVWAYWDYRVTPSTFIRAHRIMDRWITDALTCGRYSRIESYVRDEFENGHRWMELLKFRREGKMRSFVPDGADCILYARTAKD